MATQWTRRQVLAQMGIAAAAVHTLDPHELCCAVPASAETADKDLFELKKVADGVYAAVAAARYKVNSNAAVIVTDDGVVVVDSAQSVWYIPTGLDPWNQLLGGRRATTRACTRSR